jgi:hypothetical protein
MARWEISNGAGTKLGTVHATTHRRALDALAKRHGYTSEKARVNAGCAPFVGTVKRLSDKPRKKRTKTKSPATPRAAKKRGTHNTRAKRTVLANVQFAKDKGKPKKKKGGPSNHKSGCGCFACKARRK